MEKCADYGILVAFEKSAQAPLNRVVEEELKRRILAVFDARWIEKDTKRVSPRRIPGAVMHSVTLELRGELGRKEEGIIVRLMMP